MFRKMRTIILVLWIVIVIGLGYYVAMHRQLLNPEHLLGFFRSFGPWAILVYILASLVRWLVLLPSLPLVLVGVLFFPDNLLLVFLISMMGIVFSGVLIYQFSDLMGFDEFFATHLENTKIDTVIQKWGFLAIIVWSFTPVVMTDLICYVAGTVRYNFWKFVIALTIGESMMVALLIWWGKEIVNIFGR